MHSIKTLKQSAVVEFNNSYIIYNDGRLYSLHTNRFLAKIPVRDNGNVYLTYNIRHNDNPKKKHTIARLVFYHFGKHKFLKYELMKGDVINKDGNRENNRIENLLLLSRSEMNIRSGVKPKPGIARQHAKIKDTEIEQVMKLKREGFTQRAIAKFYNTSEMSVLRFLRRHSLQTSL